MNSRANVEMDDRTWCTLSASFTANVVRVVDVGVVLVLVVTEEEVVGGGSSGGSQNSILSHTGVASLPVWLMLPANEERSHKLRLASYQNDLH